MYIGRGDSLIYVHSFILLMYHSSLQQVNLLNKTKITTFYIYLSFLSDIQVFAKLLKDKFHFLSLNNVGQGGGGGV